MLHMNQETKLLLLWGYCHTVPGKIPGDVFLLQWIAILKVIGTNKRLRASKRTEIKKWESIEVLILSDFKTYYRETVNKTMCCWCKHRNIEQNRQPRNTPTHACISDFQKKRPIKFNKKICSFKAVFLVQSDTHILKENDLYTYILLYIKSNSICTIALNVKSKLIRLISKRGAKSPLELGNSWSVYRGKHKAAIWCSRSFPGCLWRGNKRCSCKGLNLGCASPRGSSIYNPGILATFRSCTLTASCWHPVPLSLPPFLPSPSLPSWSSSACSCSLLISLTLAMLAHVFIVKFLPHHA